MPLLEINDLIVLYGEIEALRGVSISVDEGQVVTLLGANGAGKSTTLRAISGLAKPAAGEILFDGRSIAGLGPEAIVRLGISHVPEGRRIFPGLSVKENIMLGASNRRIAKSELSREADAMFDLFPDIRSFSNALGWTLSGGQLQMVAVARGLMAKPRLLLLDEPSLGLAPVIVQAVFRIISEIRRNTTVLLVEQNARKGQDPIVLDFATSIVAEGKVLVASRGGKKLPKGALIDGDGTLSEDPAVLYGPHSPEGPREHTKGTGAIRAFGEHKGSGLAFICELLGGALTGTGATAPDRRFANGMFAVYVDPRVVDTSNFFDGEVSRYVDFIRATKPVAGVDAVLIPGDTERKTRADRTKNGVPLPDDTWAAIVNTAREVGVSEVSIQRVTA
jgi:ABC-type branched-subunit amino acid transport system ATPase component